MRRVAGPLPPDCQREREKEGGREAGREGAREREGERKRETRERQRQTQIDRRQPPRGRAADVENEETQARRVGGRKAGDDVVDQDEIERERADRIEDEGRD
jgi:hypothetical protein